MFVMSGYKIRHDVLLMWKITACFHAANIETVSMSFCTEVDWVMHGGITKWPLITLSLSRFKKAPLFFVGASLELHLVQKSGSSLAL